MTPNKFEEQVRKRYPDAVLEPITRRVGNRVMVDWYTVWDRAESEDRRRGLIGFGITPGKAWEDAAKEVCRNEGV